MTEILIAVPVLNRPDKAKPLVESCREATTVAHRIMFICSPEDIDEIGACVDAEPDDVHIVPWQPGNGDFAMKINLAVKYSDEPWVLMAADDLCFCPGWAENALMCAAATGAGVVGTQDCGNPRVIAGEHSTHPLVSRQYIMEQGTIDEPGKMLHEGYSHQFCDDELVETAKARRQWTFCNAAELPHNHPDWSRGAWDETYEKGRRSFVSDHQLFMRRRRLWLGH